jgi:DNA-directed RNA polymerase subunit M/transcription elongation factor TFIIS
MIRKLVIVGLTTLTLAGMAAIGMTAGKGAPKIEIFGGKKGNIPFPHAQHQDRLKDCNVCHNVFPQEKDAIKKLKAQGSIKPKKVMNLQCIKCHKQEKRAGNATGPVTCNTCHV